MGMTEPKKNGTINRQSAISVGVVVLIIAAVVWIVSATTKTEAQIENVAEVVRNLDDDYVPRRELDQRLKNIEGSVERIENYLIK